MKLKNFYVCMIVGFSAYLIFILVSYMLCSNKCLGCDSTFTKPVIQFQNLFKIECVCQGCMK